MKYFTNCKTLEELRKEYKKLVKKNHPDMGGSEEEMKIIIKIMECKSTSLTKVSEALSN